MSFRIALSTLALLASFPAWAQVGSIPPNAIDRATAVDDARRSSTSDASAADRDRAARDARDSAARIGPPPQSTMTDRVSGLNGSLTPAPASNVPAPPPPSSPN